MHVQDRQRARKEIFAVVNKLRRVTGNFGGWADSPGFCRHLPLPHLGNFATLSSGIEIEEIGSPLPDSSRLGAGATWPRFFQPRPEVLRNVEKNHLCSGAGTDLRKRFCRVGYFARPGARAGGQSDNRRESRTWQNALLRSAVLVHRHRVLLLVPQRDGRW